MFITGSFETTKTIKDKKLIFILSNLTSNKKSTRLLTVFECQFTTTLFTVKVNNFRDSSSNVCGTRVWAGPVKEVRYTPLYHHFPTSEGRRLVKDKASWPDLPVQKNYRLYVVFVLCPNYRTRYPVQPELVPLETRSQRSEHFGKIIKDGSNKTIFYSRYISIKNWHLCDVYI